MSLYQSFSEMLLSPHLHVALSIITEQSISEQDTELSTGRGLVEATMGAGRGEVATGVGRGEGAVKDDADGEAFG